MQVPIETIEMVDSWIAQQPVPQPTRPEAVRQLVDLGLAADRQQRADARSKAADAQKADAAKARLEHEQARIAEAEKTERLRVVRLAKEEHDRRVASGQQPAPKRSATRAKELAIGAVKEALAKVDAPEDVKLERKRKLVAPGKAKS